MGLVIQIGRADKHRWAPPTARQGIPDTRTATIAELGEESFLVSCETWTKISANALLRLVPTSGLDAVEVDVDLLETAPIWRNSLSWAEREHVAPLTPMPFMHLASASRTIEKYGRLASWAAWPGMCWF